jgi:hypothetical protein
MLMAGRGKQAKDKGNVVDLLTSMPAAAILALVFSSLSRNGKILVNKSTTSPVASVGKRAVAAQGRADGCEKAGMVFSTD